MSDTLSNNPDSNLPSGQMENSTESLLQLLRQKQQNWIAWGQACQQLQKSGYSPQRIFEETGFEPVQQNQVIVAAQVYASIVSAGISPAVKERFARTGSDILYELRILPQGDRAAAAEFITQRNLDSVAAAEVAKAMKDYARLRSLPEGFTNTPGDGVAYQYWRLAKQQQSLPEKSRLIVRGLMFAQSQSAKEEIEKLLSPTSNPGGKSPHLPIYRLESGEELPIIVPLAGNWPLTLEAWQRVLTVKSSGSFGVCRAAGEFVALPGWQVLRQVGEAVGVLADAPVVGLPPGETVLLVFDRTQTTWRPQGYFLCGVDSPEISWDCADQKIWAQLVLVLRPKSVLERAKEDDIWEDQE